MEKTKVLIIALAVMVALNLGLTSFLLLRGGGRHHKGEKCHDRRECKMEDNKCDEGEQNGKKKGHKIGFGKDKMAAQLGFSEEQKKSLDALQKNHFSAQEINREKEHKTRDELMQLLQADKVDVSKKDSLLKEISSNKLEMSKAFFTHFESIKTLCTAEQKVKFDSLLIDMSQKMKQHRMPE